MYIIYMCIYVYMREFPNSLRTYTYYIYSILYTQDLYVSH